MARARPAGGEAVQPSAWPVPVAQRAVTVARRPAAGAAAAGRRVLVRPRGAVTVEIPSMGAVGAGALLAMRQPATQRATGVEAWTAAAAGRAARSIRRPVPAVSVTTAATAVPQA